MRFALSAAAAASGLLLLGLAVFGQPDVYLRLAREQWESLIDSTPAEPTPDQMQPNAAIVESMARLQQQVAQLRDELSAKRADAEHARQALSAAQAQRQAAEQLRQAAEQPRQGAEQPRQGADQLPFVPPAPSDAVAVTERHEAAAAATAVDRRDQTLPPERRGASKPAIPAPRPVLRQEPENAQSVLARLRQAAPIATATAPDGPPPAERVKRGPSPALRRLIAARSALASGQVDDARRLLQEAQLQLVFRPVGSAEDDPTQAGRAASDVARALDALSGSDTALSRSYIDRAVVDTSGLAADTSVPDEAPQGNGYAPAYPLR